jgi:hypothetical protein
MYRLVTKKYYFQVSSNFPQVSTVVSKVSSKGFLEVFVMVANSRLVERRGCQTKIIHNFLGIFRVMANCPCCSDRLLSRVRPGSLYWWCPSCVSEMPDLSAYSKSTVVSYTRPALIPTLQPMPVALRKITPAKNPSFWSQNSTKKLAA